MELMLGGEKITCEEVEVSYLDGETGHITSKDTDIVYINPSTVKRIRIIYKTK
jgi:hypothetical protein